MFTILEKRTAINGNPDYVTFGLFTTLDLAKLALKKLVCSHEAYEIIETKNPDENLEPKWSLCNVFEYYSRGDLAKVKTEYVPIEKVDTIEDLKPNSPCPKIVLYLPVGQKPTSMRVLSCQQMYDESLLKQSSLGSTDEEHANFIGINFLVGPEGFYIYYKSRVEFIGSTPMGCKKTKEGLPYFFTPFSANSNRYKLTVFKHPSHNTPNVSVATFVEILNEIDSIKWPFRSYESLNFLEKLEKNEYLAYSYVLRNGEIFINREIPIKSVRYTDFEISVLPDGTKYKIGPKIESFTELEVLFDVNTEVPTIDEVFQVLRSRVTNLNFRRADNRESAFDLFTFVQKSNGVIYPTKKMTKRVGFIFRDKLCTTTNGIMYNLDDNSNLKILVDPSSFKINYWQAYVLTQLFSEQFIKP
ncbi:MAG: hypothetical protein ACRCXZ_02855 [Patescibacteria group bacterium]